MSGLIAKIWPHTKTWKRSILWALGVGFIVQIGVPSILGLIGAQRAALYSMLPGLWPILWATGGWFASVGPLGYLLMYSINTIVYGLVLLIGLRGYASLKRHCARQPQNT